MQNQHLNESSIADPNVVQTVIFDLVTNASITASFEPVQGLLDNYNVTIIDPDDLNSVLNSEIATPTGNVGGITFCVAIALRQP